MSPDVQVAVVGAVATVAVAFIGWLQQRQLKGIRRDTAVTKEQVTNSHEENLRVEMTRQFNDVHLRMDRQAAAWAATAAEVRQVNARLTSHIDGGPE